LSNPAPSFASLFARDADIADSAPGRVNLIGEHTDYNEGFVLPTVIPRRTRVELAARANELVRACSLSQPDHGVLEYELGSEQRGRGWLDYVQGVTFALRGANLPVEGFDLRVSSDVPIGAGLASSAALTVALLRALRRALHLQLDDVALARLARAAEADFVGAPVGLMDQMASSLCAPGQALMIDMRSLAFERIALPSGADLVIIDSGLPHAHAVNAYRRRREECERAAAGLGVQALRDVGEEQLAQLALLPDPEARRARHVITENARVLRAASALRGGDLQQLGELLFASHASLRDDFEASCAELDLLVELARAQSAAFGARMTGGGFGGAILALVRAGAGAHVAQAVSAAYEQRAAHRAAWFIVPAGEQGRAG
jgi:galactokinase